MREITRKYVPRAIHITASTRSHRGTCDSGLESPDANSSDADPARGAVTSSSADPSEPSEPPGAPTAPPTQLANSEDRAVSQSESVERHEADRCSRYSGTSCGESEQHGHRRESMVTEGSREGGRPVQQVLRHVLWELEQHGHGGERGGGMTGAAGTPL